MWISRDKWNQILSKVETLGKQESNLLNKLAVESSYALEKEKQIEKLDSDIRYWMEELNKKNAKIKELEEQLILAEAERYNPIHVVEAVMKKKIEWYDFHELEASARLKYYQDAQQILTSEVFNNEISYLVSCWAKWALSNAPDYNGVRDMRMSTSALQLLRERLTEIDDPNKITTADEIYSAI